MATLRLSAHAVSKGEPLLLTVGDHPALTDTTTLGIRLFGVEKAETALRLVTGVPATAFDGELVATIDGTNVTDMLHEDHL